MSQSHCLKDLRQLSVKMLLYPDPEVQSEKIRNIRISTL